MNATTDNIESAAASVARAGGYHRPASVASSSKRRQRPLPTNPLSPPSPTEGGAMRRLRRRIAGDGTLCRGCAGSDACSKERSRRLMWSSHYEPDDSARVGEGRSKHRGRVYVNPISVAWERPRRELGYNLVSVTRRVTPPEGQVVRSGDERRARKLVASCSDSSRNRGHSAWASRPCSESVGHRLFNHCQTSPYRKPAIGANTQDSSRKKTGSTAPAFSRAYNPTPPATDAPQCGVAPARGGNVRRTKGARTPNATTTANLPFLPLPPLPPLGEVPQAMGVETCGIKPHDRRGFIPTTIPPTS